MSKENGGWLRVCSGREKDAILFITSCFFPKEDTKVVARERINMKGIQ